MDDWPQDPEGVEDDAWDSPDEQARRLRQDPFSLAVGDVWEEGRPGTILDGML
jgi:hypothetical protein